MVRAPELEIQQNGKFGETECAWVGSSAVALLLPYFTKLKNTGRTGAKLVSAGDHRQITGLQKKVGVEEFHEAASMETV